MFFRPMFRLVPDGTRIKFMRGRFAGLAVSAILSLTSVGLFFYPGLNLGIDFRGGIVMEARTPAPADFGVVRLRATTLPGTLLGVRSKECSNSWSASCEDPLYFIELSG